jgi:hypothetical protein
MANMILSEYFNTAPPRDAHAILKSFSHLIEHALDHCTDKEDLLEIIVTQTRIINLLEKIITENNKENGKLIKQQKEEQG